MAKSNVIIAYSKIGLRINIVTENGTDSGYEFPATTTSISYDMSKQEVHINDASRRDYVLRININLIANEDQPFGGDAKDYAIWISDKYLSISGGANSNVSLQAYGSDFKMEVTDSKQTDLMKEVLNALRITNYHLSIISNVEIRDEEIL